MATSTYKGFIKDWQGNKILPITRGELVLDKDGKIALNSEYFLAGYNGSNNPGLVTAAERAMLSTGSTNGAVSIGSLAEKLDHINKGLQFNESQLKFYNDSGTATPIKITADPLNGITLNPNIQNNTVSLGLTRLGSGTTISKIIKNITVDAYGRVTSVSGEALTNNDLPETISNKKFNNCTTQEEEIPENTPLAIVNKAYVDKKFTAANTIATGALKFGGTIRSQSDVTNCLNKDHWYNYYKITAGFDLNTDNFYEPLEITSVSVKAGDTIIIYPVNNVAKIVYIPSGDDITTITVKNQDKSPVLREKIGNVTFSFSPVFTVEASSSNSKTALITLPQVTTALDGYLSKGDYAEFKSYGKSSYKSSLTTQAGLYNIGKLTLGNTEYTIQGINNESKLTLENGDNNLALNPKLKFKETGQNDVNITLQGQAGISIQKAGDSIQIGANIEDTSKKYLTTNENNQLKVVIGDYDISSKTVIDGLVDYGTFYELVQSVGQTTIFETISYSLSGTDDTKYQYGNAKLKAAVNVINI